MKNQRTKPIINAGQKSIATPNDFRQAPEIKGT